MLDHHAQALQLKNKERLFTNIAALCHEEEGAYPFLGDVNADGMEDLIQITPTGDPWVALLKGDSFDYPERWGWLGFLFDRKKGYLPFYLDY